MYTYYTMLLPLQEKMNVVPVSYKLSSKSPNNAMIFLYFYYTPMFLATCNVFVFVERAKGIRPLLLMEGEHFVIARNHVDHVNGYFGLLF